MRKGPAVKNTVDEAIEQCAEVYSLLDSIEEARTRAEQATDDKQKRVHATKGLANSFHKWSHNRTTDGHIARIGLHNLRRYFELIVFQYYLQSTEPDTLSSFENIETFVKSRPGAFISTTCLLHLER